MNFQGAATAIACVYMARGRPLLWLDKLVDDTPIAVDAETGGAGDDIRLLLKNTQTVEVQVKKGLTATKLWDPLLKLAAAIEKGAVDFGVMLVSPTSSNTITNDLANDILRIGGGRTDNLSKIAKLFLSKLTASNISAHTVCARLRIQTVSALEANQAAVLAARAELAHLCADEAQIGAAWNALYKDSMLLIEQRGRRDVAAVLRLLVADGIELAASTNAAPALLLAKLARWTLDTNATFGIFGVGTQLSIDEAWIPLTAIVHDESETEDTSLEDALRRYQDWETRSAQRNARSVDPETLGRFVTRTVLVAGPGMGKTTLLKRIARRYSEDAIPVLRVRLSAVAARMRDGATFEEAVFYFGLGESGIAVSDAQSARFPNWTLLCDGLDECGSLQEEVAAGVARFAIGHPDSRILITTRPIGYHAAHFKEWRHYDLSALDTLGTWANAARLIEAIVPQNSELHQNAWDICRREFRDRPTATIVGRTPLLLGLAVAIMVRGKSLGTTRERLFEQIFELIDEAPNARIPDPPAPAVLLNRFLDILGWHITSQPLASTRDTCKRCAADLATDTRATPVMAAADAERYLGYWQDVGMIERVGLGGQQTLTFIHKSFGEFAAARYLRSLPPADQAEAVANTLDAPAWSEVMRLCGLMGMADVLATQLLAESGGSAVAKRMLLATELVAEANPPPNQTLRGRIINRAFTINTCNLIRSIFYTGTPLVAAARRFPEEVGPVAALYLEAERPWTRLIAWACAVAAGPQYYALDALIAALRETVETLESGVRQSLGGGMVLPRGTNANLGESFALEACAEIMDRAPAEIVNALLPEILNHDNLATSGFRSKATALMLSKGRHYPIAPSKWDGSQLFPEIPGYLAASRVRYDALFDALDLPKTPTASDDSAPHVLLHLSAFIEASQMKHLPVTDLGSWLRPFDRDTTRAVLQGLIAVSGLDVGKLREDAMHAKRYLNNKLNEDGDLLNITTHVDPQPVDWERAKTLDLDAKLIEAAIAHPSDWVKWVAANLLLGMLDPEALEDAARRLIDTDHARISWAACGVVAGLDRDRALALTLDRLTKPLVPGCEHLLNRLRALTPPWTQKLESVVRAGLFAADVETAIATANIATDFAAPTFPQLAPMLEQAYAHWLVQEEPSPTKRGIIPNSPRAKLVEALRKIRPALYVDIKGYVTDSRSDIRELGAVALAERLKQPEGERLQFFSDIEKGEVKSLVLARVLKDGLPLTPLELNAAEALLKSESKEILYNAMALLTDRYLDRDRIRFHANTLVHDGEEEIRDRAFAILDMH